MKRNEKSPGPGSQSDEKCRRKHSGGLIKIADGSDKRHEITSYTRTPHSIRNGLEMPVRQFVSIKYHSGSRERYILQYRSFRFHSYHEHSSTSPRNSPATKKHYELHHVTVGVHLITYPTNLRSIKSIKKQKSYGGLKKQLILTAVK